MKNNFFGSLLDVIPFATYAVDIENYQVVYINKILNDRIYAPEEKLCWKKYMDKMKYVVGVRFLSLWKKIN